MPAAIDARGLTKRYGRIAGLEELSLTVEPGETFAVECVEGWSNFFRHPDDMTRDGLHDKLKRAWDYLS